MKRTTTGAALALILALTPAYAQRYQDSSGTAVPGVVPIAPGVGPLFTTANPGKVSGTFSATLNGFAPGNAYASLSVGSSSANVALPTGTVVVVYNTGANAAYVKLGASNAVTATSGNDVVPAGGWLAFTVGSNTYLAAIETAGATSLNLSGGAGLPTGSGGGGSGGGVASSVTITAVPADGSATASTAITAADAASTSSAGFGGQSIWTGSPTAASYETFALNTNQGALVSCRGTFTSTTTLVAEQTQDSASMQSAGTAHWVQALLTIPGQTSGNAAAAASFNAPFENASINAGALQGLRFRVPSGDYTSGDSISCTMRTTLTDPANVLAAAMAALTYQNGAAAAANGGAQPPQTNQVGGFDGTNLQPLSVTTPGTPGAKGVGVQGVTGGVPMPIAGFQPTPSYAQLSVGATSSRVGLPTGSVVIVYNTGANPAFVTLGNSSVTATTSNDVIPAGGWLAFTVGSNTYLAAIETAGTTSLNISGGTGWPNGSSGGGSSGGGSNASVGSTGSPAPGSATYNGMLVSGGNMVGASGSAWGSAPTGLNVLGVNADIISSALPAGAATAANQNATTAGTSATSAQAVQGVTGGVPMPTYGANTAGNAIAIVQAGASVPISMSTATTTQLVGLVSGKAIYVTAWDVIASGTTNFTFEYGTGTNCAIGPTPLTGAYALVAQFGAAKGGGLGPVLIVPAGNALCAVNSAAVQVSGSLAYTQF